MEPSVLLPRYRSSKSLVIRDQRSICLARNSVYVRQRLIRAIRRRSGRASRSKTGWTDAKLKSDPKTWISGEPGLSNEGAVYLASLNPMAVGVDTWGIEAIPPAHGDAEEGVHEFMFVLGQARIKGTTQMIINPVAVW
uniref:Cyclase n=1 Tax=Candidatus Kentrum sp. TC TaxID=2126339 RepID=A0A450ZR83_9GAMM|nr:MAG: Putative cyclase [Candidatus Kentron sp. TC]